MIRTIEELEMTKQKKIKVQKRLEEHYKFAKTKYSEERILGIFLYGSQNYKMDVEDSDVDSILVVLPTFEDLLFKKNWLSKEIYMPDNNEHIVVKDIRCYREELLKQNLNYLETLIGEFYILNPKYQFLFQNYFINNRQEIANYNVQNIKNAVASQTLNTLKQYDALGGNLNHKAAKKLANAYRLFCTIQTVSTVDYSFERLFDLKPEDLAIAMKIKRNQATMAEKDKYYILIKQTAEAALKTPSQAKLNEAGYNAASEGTAAIMRYSFNYFANDCEESDKDAADFREKLTKKENEALKAIVKEIGGYGDGTFNVSKLMKDTQISRTVFSNLLKKLKIEKVATSTNLGVGGTYIKFIREV